MLRVGITGGIGSGKSTVCRIFEALGVPIYDADYWAKWLIENDPTLVAGIVDLLGPEAYVEGRYQRAWVAARVFADADLLRGLNGLVHPAVEVHSRRWHEAQAEKQVPYTLKEAALMIESGAYKYLDQLIVVSAPESIRVARVMARDGLSETEVRARITRQLPDNQRIIHAQFIIENDGSQALIPQVWAIHQKLKGE
jgi:dephospho-CoA kinase